MKNFKNINVFLSENSDKVMNNEKELDFIMNYFEISNTEGKEESVSQFLMSKKFDADDLINLLDEYKKFCLSKLEDGDGGGGVATATAGTTSGMGNVSSAQPASTPGATVTGDGTTGSGDYGNPLFQTAQKDGSNTVGKKRGKKKKNKKKESIIQNFLTQHKASKDGSSSKMFTFKDFVNNDTKK